MEKAKKEVAQEVSVQEQQEKSNANMVRYSPNTKYEWRRFEITDLESEEKLIDLLDSKDVSREDLIFILKTVKLRDFMLEGQAQAQPIKKFIAETQDGTCSGTKITDGNTYDSEGITNPFIGIKDLTLLEKESEEFKLLYAGVRTYPPIDCFLDSQSGS